MTWAEQSLPRHVQEVEDRFAKVGIKLPLKKADIKDAQDNFDNWSASMTQNANKLSPLYILNEQTKVATHIGKLMSCGCRILESLHDSLAKP